MQRGLLAYWSGRPASETTQGSRRDANPTGMSKRLLLGVAIRASWLGYAVIDAECRLIDWGMIFYRRKNDSQIEAAKRRIAALLNQRHPTLIAIAKSPVMASIQAPTVRLLAQWVRKEAAANTIRCVWITRTKIYSAFHSFEPSSKDDVGSALAHLFPELSHWLPSRRRLWQKEHYRMALFDATAAAFTAHQFLLQSESAESA